MDSLFQHTTVDVGGIPVAMLRGGSGRPLLVLHDELGFAGWMGWNRTLARDFELLMPLQPGFGVTPRCEWFECYRDVGDFYHRMLREMDLGPVDVIGFSAGGFIAAEMAVACPDAFAHLVLVAPLGVRPKIGEIADVLALTVRSHVALTVSRVDAPEFAEIYGGAMTTEQFELFEAARAETSRLGWEPFLYSPSLPHRLGGLNGLPTLITWGTEDLVVPRSCVDIYEAAIPGALRADIDGAGHRPEIEAPEEFLTSVCSFLSQPALERNARV